MRLARVGRLVSAFAVVATIVAVIVDVRPAAAASITVNTALDIAPNAQGKFPTDGLCSLRAAIRSAQNNSNAHDVDCSTGAPVPGVLDVIQINPSLAGQTMTLTWSVGGQVQPFDVITGADNPMSIIGPTTNNTQFVIHGGNNVRPFIVGFLNVQPGDLTLANLTVRGGNAKANVAGAPAVDGEGGALYAGYNSKITLDNVVMRNNSAVAPNARGGAIFGQAVTITNNGGGYIQNSATGVGQGGRGGAIFIEEGPATVNGYAMLLQQNSATYAGGAISTNPGASAALLHLERSLIRDNTAQNGGVMYIDSSQPGLVMDLTDSTLTGNSSVFFSQSSKQNFRFVRNTFVDTGKIFSAGGGYMANSIVKGANTCTFMGGGSGVTGSRNRMAPFAQAGDCGIAAMNPLGGVTGLSATLAQNGGPTVQQTFALASNSNAIDQGNPAECGTIDARSVPRGIDGNGILNNPQVGDCDIGAYEYAKYVVNFVTGTSTANEGSPFTLVQARLRILDAAINSLPSAISIPIGVDPTSTATPGLTSADTDGDFNVLGGNQVTFPAGSVDNAVASIVIDLHQDDVAELFGEQAYIDLKTPPSGVSIAEPKRHTLSIQDDDQAGVVVTETGGSTQVDESMTAVSDSIQVRLQSRPDRELLDPTKPGDPASYGAFADVEMTITPDRDCTIESGGVTGTEAAPLVRTILNANWNVNQTINIFPVDDPWDEDFRVETTPHKCELRFTFNSADPIYDATQDAFEVNVIDNDINGVVIMPFSGTGLIAENSADVAVYHVSLVTPPDPGKPLPNPARGPTNIVFTPNAGCSVGAGPGMPVAVPFDGSDFATPKSVNVTAVDDPTVELLHTCDVKTSIASEDPFYANLDDMPPFARTPGDVTTPVQDYDPPGITDDPPFAIVDTTGGVNVDESTPGVADTVSVVLHRQPLGMPVQVQVVAPMDPVISGSQALVRPVGGALGTSATLTFTPANWNVPQLVEILPVDDFYDETDTHPWTLFASINSSAVGFNDPNLRRVVVDGVEHAGSAPFGITIADNDTSGMVTFETGGSTEVAENGMGDEIAVQVTTHPYADVTIDITADGQCTVDGGSSTTLTIPAASWNIPIMVMLAATDDSDLEGTPHPCVLTYDANSTDLLYDVLTQPYTVNVIDDELPQVLVSTMGGVSVGEDGLTDTFEVVLSSHPTADVTVTFDDVDGQTTSPASITFTPADWNVPQTVTVGAFDDDIDEGSNYSGAIVVGVTSTAVGYDTMAEILVDGMINTSFAVSIIDDDTGALVATATDGSTAVTEGGTGDTFTVQLATQPTSNVTVIVTVTNGQCTVDGGMTTSFPVAPADWNVPVVVDVAAVDDGVLETSPHPCTMVIEASSGDLIYDALTAPLTADVTDNEVASVIVTTDGKVDVGEGGKVDTFDVVLGAQPTADVTVTLAGDGQITVPASLTFTSANWNMPQQVTVMGVDDDVDETDPHASSIAVGVMSASVGYDTAAVVIVDGTSTAVVPVEVSDNDTAAVVGVHTNGSTTVVEGGAGDTVLVRLGSMPSAPVTVTVAADAQCRVNGATSAIVTIPAADWNVSVSLMIDAVDDMALEGTPHSCSLTLSAASADPAYAGLSTPFTVNVTDNDVPHVLVSTGDGVMVSETGTTDTFSVVLASQPTADVTVTATPDAQTGATPSVTFTPGNWNIPQSITVSAVDDDVAEDNPHAATVTLGVTSTAVGYGSSPVVLVDAVMTATVGVSVGDDDVAALVPSIGAFELIEAGTPLEYTVSLQSKPTATVFISLTSVGLCGVVPATLTFFPDQWNTPQKVTVTPGQDLIRTDATCMIHYSVSSADARYAGIFTAPTGGAVIDDDVARVNITYTGSIVLHEATPMPPAGYQIALSSEPLADVTVTVTPDAQVTVDKTSVVFTPANWNQPQTVGVSAVDDTMVEASPHGGTVSHSVSSADSFYNTPAVLFINGGPASTVNAEIGDNETVTQLTLNPNVTDDQTPVSASATITGGGDTPTGLVQFFVDSAPFSSPVALVDGTAQFLLGPFAAGTHEIEAAYMGDIMHEPSAATALIDVAAHPIAVDDTATGVEDGGAITIAVVDNDTDVDSATLSVEPDSWVQGANGAVTCSASTCSYTPAANFHGTDTFTYVVTDGALTDSATVTVTVTPVNDAPTVELVSIEVGADEPTTFNVLAGATDPDGDPLTLAGYSQPQHGTVTCEPDGTCTYTPEPGYTGPDDFTFSVTDGTGVTAAVIEGAVTIIVTASPGGPTTGPTGANTGSSVGTSGSTGSSTTYVSTSSLPATGLTVLPLLLVAAALIGGGGALARSGHRKRAASER